MIKFKRLKADELSSEMKYLIQQCSQQTINIGNTRIIEITADEPLVYIIDGVTEQLDEVFDARLEDWHVEATTKGPRLKGRIYGDKKLRFEDGQYVQTSPFVASRTPLKSGDIVQTKTSSYLLGTKLNLSLLGRTLYEM